MGGIIFITTCRVAERVVVLTTCRGYVLGVKKGILRVHLRACVGLELRVLPSALGAWSLA